jgi:hypothetical protein
VKKVINTITESGLFLLLLMIVFATTISVISLSPRAKQTTVNALDSDTKQVAGTSTFSNDTFAPFLATDHISFGSQELKSNKYSTIVSFDTLKKGDNNADIVRVINKSNETKIFTFSFSFDTEEIGFTPYLNLGESSVLLTEHYKGPTGGSIDFDIKPGEQKIIGVKLSAKAQINYPVKVHFSLLDKLN